MVFWLLNALSNQYNSTLNFGVKYIKPALGNGTNVIVNDYDLPRQLQININALGRDIVWYSIASYLSHIEIDLSKKMLNSKNRTKGFINSNELFKSVTKKLTANVNILNVEPSVINLKFDKYYLKKVPVKVDDKDAVLPSGVYKNNYQTIPDSVEVSGARNLLVSRKVWNTVPVEVNETGKVHEVDIELSQIKGVNVNPNIVKLIIEPDRYTENERLVKIKKVNIPRNIKITTFSKEVKVKFNAPISLIEDIESEDITITADFSDVDLSIEKTVRLKETKIPSYINVVSIEPSDMEFSIQKIK